MSRIHRVPSAAVGVVIPVHNEEALLPRALDFLGEALAGLPCGIRAQVAIILDDCSDLSEDIAWQWSRSHQAVIVTERAGNVGAARRSGCETILAGWSQVGYEAMWLATTDADSQVPADWLTAQLSASHRGVDFWAGRVMVTDWSAHSEGTKGRWTARYADERDPVHGASLGFSASTYVRLGGFRPLQTGEDRDLYRRAVSRRCRILHDTAAVVETSGRRHGRAPRGFADALRTTVENLAPTA
jgi:hypothetical protein